MNIERGAALDQKLGEVVIAVQNTESAGPPVAALVDVRAVGEQQIDHLRVSA